MFNEMKLTLTHRDTCYETNVTLEGFATKIRERRFLQSAEIRT